MTLNRNGRSSTPTTNSIQAFLQSDIRAARALYETVESQYSDTFEYVDLPDEFAERHNSLMQRARRAGVIEYEKRYVERDDSCYRTLWRLSDEFREMMDERSRQREGWCVNADCDRTAIVHDSDGPHCRCGADLKEEVVG